jgi:hypothetical protein
MNQDSTSTGLRNLTDLPNRALMEVYRASIEDVEHYSEYGTWGDGKKEAAKAESKRIRKEILKRMKGKK